MPHPRKPDPQKFCANCGAEMFRREYNGRLEDRGVFLRRKHCSLTCFGLKRYKPRREAGALSKATYHFHARKMRKDRCEACGERRSLVAHHVDQDYKNNSPENIQTLCSFCHDFWHSTQKRLGKSVAGPMPRLWEVE